MRGLLGKLQGRGASSHLPDADPAMTRDYYQSVIDSCLR